MALNQLTDLQPTNIKVTGIATFDQTVGIAGTLTYQDVTNVDAVGILTARSDINALGNIIGDNATNISGINSVTATTLYGTLAGSTATFTGDLDIAGSLRHIGDTDTKISFDTNIIHFDTDNTERIRIDNGGKLLIGLSTRRLFATGHTSQLQIEGLDSLIQSSLSIVNNQNTTGSPNIRLGKTRGTSIGSNTSVADGDDLGQIIFYGADGTDIYNATGLIGAVVNGTVGTDTIPTDLVFETSATTGSGRAERVRITSGGRLLVNSTVARNVGTNINRMLQIESSGGGAGLAAVRNSNNVSGPSLDFGKSRGYPNTIVQSGDVLGQIRFAGADGTDLESPAAHIKVEVDGTPGSNDMPGRIVFSTSSDGAASPTEKLRIHSGGEVTKLHNPRFQVYKSGSHFQLSSGSGEIVYNTEVYDTGSNYNTSNGRFTAPVSGAYYFHHCLQIRASLSGTGVIESKIWVIPNGGSAQERIRDYQRVDDVNAVSHAFGLLGLNAGDQVYPAYYNGVSGNCFTQNNGGYTPLTTFFEGYLIQ